jgi:hypothetical protein
MDLISTLVNALGITEKQAEGRRGRLFNNAKENLSTEDFNKASDAVPGVDQYMAEAPSTDSAEHRRTSEKRPFLTGRKRIQNWRHGRSDGFLFKTRHELRNPDQIRAHCYLITWNPRQDPALRGY